MAFYHKIFVINYSLTRVLRRFVAQDEVEVVGHEKTPTSLQWTVIAPSQEVALADFKERHQLEIKDKDYNFELGTIETREIDRCLLSLQLD